MAEQKDVKRESTISTDVVTDHIVVIYTGPNAKTPTKGTIGAAGYDLYAAEAFVIPPKKRQLIKTNLFMAIAVTHYGRIAPRSGLAYKNGIDVLAGVIDSDYRGNVGVILLNTDQD